MVFSQKLPNWPLEPAHIPEVQQLLEEYFDKELSKGINPNEAVAYGAAVQGGILSGREVLDDAAPVDIYLFSIGIETAGGVFAKLIPCDTIIPAHEAQIPSTAALIRVYEGERSLTEDDNLLGKFELTSM